MRVLMLASLVTALGVGIAFAPATSSALSRDVECVLDAKDEYKSCKTICREIYRADKDFCWDVSEECAEYCREQVRVPCMEAPLATLALCKDQCNTIRQGAKQDCRDLWEPDSPEREACIYQAALDAFECRYTCRQGVKGTLRNCRYEMRQCLKAEVCPPEE